MSWIDFLMCSLRACFDFEQYSYVYSLLSPSIAKKMIDFKTNNSRKNGSFILFAFSFLLFKMTYLNNSEPRNILIESIIIFFNNSQTLSCSFPCVLIFPIAWRPSYRYHTSISREHIYLSLPPSTSTFQIAGLFRKEYPIRINELRLNSPEYHYLLTLHIHLQQRWFIPRFFSRNKDTQRKKRVVISIIHRCTSL